MSHRTVHYVLDQYVTTNKISQKGIGYKKGNKGEQGPFKQFLLYLFCIPRLFFEFQLFGSVPFNPVFNFTEHHFHKNGLWTHPSAKDPSENYRKQDDKDHGYQKGKHQKIKVLWPEGLSENIKLPVDNIEQKKLISIDPDKWRGEQNCEQEPAYIGSVICVPALRFLGMDKIPFTFLINCGNTVSKIFVFTVHFKPGGYEKATLPVQDKSSLFYY
jgi:hypothetical protein